jgi:hypothetical protein
MEAVIPLKLVTPSFRKDVYDEKHNDEVQVIDLELVIENWEKTQLRVMEY